MHHVLTDKTHSIMADIMDTSGWTFLTNHAHVLLCIAKNPDCRLRDIADEVGITERAVHRLVSDLAESGFVDVRRDGRCNVYVTHPEKNLRHPIEAHRQVSDLIMLMERV